MKIIENYAISNNSYMQREPENSLIFYQDSDEAKGRVDGLVPCFCRRGG